jgi:RNA polymerase sigma factor (sigma-70 family)
MDGKENGDIITLWNAFLEGDDKAFAAIYFTYIQQLLSYGRKLTHQNEIIPDAVQDVFIELYERRGKKNFSVMNPKAYLFASLKNSILKKLTQNSKIHSIEMNAEKSAEFRSEFSFQDQIISLETTEETRHTLYNAIQALSSGQKEIIFLKFEQGLGYNDISKVMNITVESARKQLYRALVSLRNILDKKTIFNFFYILTKNS